MNWILNPRRQGPKSQKTQWRRDKLLVFKLDLLSYFETFWNHMKPYGKRPERVQKSAKMLDSPRDLLKKMTLKHGETMNSEFFEWVTWVAWKAFEKRLDIHSSELLAKIASSFSTTAGQDWNHGDVLVSYDQQ